MRITRALFQESVTKHQEKQGFITPLPFARLPSNKLGTPFVLMHTVIVTVLTNDLLDLSD